MFERVTDEEERGQVGIGTLIVFIAMVLVAAIAAGVLINTAGLLQSQAVATGEESTAQVSNVVQVDSATGQVTEDPDEEYYFEDGLNFTASEDNWGSDEEVVLEEGDFNVTVYDYDGDYIEAEIDGELQEVDGTVQADDFDDQNITLTGESTVEVEYNADTIDDDDQDELDMDDTDATELRLNSDDEAENDAIAFDIEPNGEYNERIDLNLAEEDSDLLADGVYDEVREASIMVSLGPGADAVDLGAATFEFVGDQTVRGQAEELEDLDIENLDGEDVDNEVIEGDRNLQVNIDLAANNDGFNTIESGDSAEFRITTADGAQTVEVLMAPSAITDSAVSL